MVTDFPLEVEDIEGGRPQATTLKLFLADNEAAPKALLAAVSCLTPGKSIDLVGSLGIRVSRPAAASRAGRRIARFPVPGLRIDGAASVTLLVNRQAGTIGVRLKHRRTLYELPIADVAALIFDRVSRANAGVGRLVARRRRR